MSKPRKSDKPLCFAVQQLATETVNGFGGTVGHYLGTPELKGLARPLGVHRIDGPRALDDEPSKAPFGAPLVGRDRELRQLLEAWTAAKQGLARTVVLSGEPGVGKSRLLATLKDALDGEPHRWLDLRCSPLGVNTAFRPVADPSGSSGETTVSQRASPTGASVFFTKPSISV